MLNDVMLCEELFHTPTRDVLVGSSRVGRNAGENSIDLAEIG